VAPTAPGAPSSDRAGLEASMVVIGDEILGGYVTDTNSAWLADRLCAHGVPFSRVQVVPDAFDAIDEALQTELGRSRPRLIVTSGGIGSTPDDITFEAVARSLDLEVVEDPTISHRLDRVVDWSRRQGLDAGDRFVWHLKRMARIPAGGRLLQHGDSWVPAVAVDVDGGCQADGATVVILPGVPSEFRRLVGEVVEPTFLEGRNPIPTVVEIEHRFPESALNLCFEELGERFPQVKLGSYPGAPMLVRLTGERDEVAGAASLVRATLERIQSSPAGTRLAAAWSRRGNDDDDRDRESDRDGDGVGEAAREEETA
jgi:nicotinamide-nucleotide amidase